MNPLEIVDFLGWEWVMFPLPLSRALESSDEAILLMVLCKLQRNFGNKEFYHTLEQLQDLLAMSKRTLQTSRDSLEEKGILRTRYDRINHLLYWSINGEKLREHLAKRDFGKSTGGISGNAGSGSSGNHLAGFRNTEREDRKREDKEKDEKTLPSFKRTINPVVVRNWLREVKQWRKEFRDSRTYPPEFLSFWSVYPPRPGNKKGKSFKLWCAIIESGVLPIVLEEGAIRYRDYCIAEHKEPQYIRQATTWLNPDDESWNDPWMPSSNGNGNGNGKIRQGGAKRVEGRGEFKYGEEFTFE